MTNDASPTLSDSQIDAVVMEIAFDPAGLIPVIAQQVDSHEVLMMAWMNEQAVRETLRTSAVTYWSRSRKRLWRKGESSGQFQKLCDFRIDCDGDTLLLQVAQTGVACHTGRRSCFFRAPRNGILTEIMPIEQDPAKLYGKH